MSRAFDKIKAGFEDVLAGRFRVAHPSARFVALVHPQLKGRTIYCDPDPTLISQLIETGRAEVEL